MANDGLISSLLRHPDLRRHIQPPIGSIVAWHRDMAGVPDLPDGWVECNGQAITDAASPFYRQTVPNLNGEGRFLRGWSTSGVEAD